MCIWKNFQGHFNALSTHERSALNPNIKLEAAFTMTLQQLSKGARKWLYLCSRLNAAMIPLSYLKVWLNGASPAAIIAELEEHALLRYNAQEEVFSLHLELQRIFTNDRSLETVSDTLHLLKTLGDRWSLIEIPDWSHNIRLAAIWTSHAEFFLQNTESLSLSLNLLEFAALLDQLGSWGMCEWPI